MYDNIKKRKIFCYFFSLLFSFIFNMNLAFGTELESTTTDTPASNETDNSNSGSAGTAIVEPEGDSDKSKTFTSSSTIKGVKIDIEADKDTYTLEDTAKFTVTLDNTNPYSVFVKDIQFGLPEYIEKQIIAALPEKLEANKSYTPVEVEVKLGFTQWVPVVLNNEQLNIGIKASLETIPADSKFVVSMVSESSGSDNEYHDLLSKFDKKDNIERICFFDFSITGQDASDVRELNGYAKLYIQIPKDWDEGQLEAMFVADGNDENFEEKIEEVDGVKYLTFSTNHFSPYALFDPANIDQEMLENLSKDFMQTGHSDLKTILVLVGVAVVSLVLALVFSNKFRKSVFGIIIFLSFCNTCMLAQATTTPVGSGVGDTYTAPLNIKFEIIDSKGSNTNEINVLPKNLIVKSYADNDLWARKDTITEDETKPNAPEILNVFFVGPSIFDETYEKSVKVGNMSIFDTRAQACLDNQSTYLKKCLEKLKPFRYYVPYYRTVTIPTYADSNWEEYFEDAYSDVLDAFNEYLDKIKPADNSTVLLGFGPGVYMCQKLAKDKADCGKLKSCLCFGLGKEDFYGTAEHNFFTSNVATIADSDQTADVQINEIVFDESFDISKDFESYNNDFDLGCKLFDITTGQVCTEFSDVDKYEILITPKKYKTSSRDGFTDFATIFKVELDTTKSGYAKLKDMIEKTEKYIGKGVYHLFDYQIFYKDMLNMLTGTQETEPDAPVTDQ